MPHPLLQGPHGNASASHRRAERVAQIVETMRPLKLRSLERPAEAPQDRSLVERPGRVGIGEHESIATLPTVLLRRSSSPATSSAIGTLRVERRDFGVPRHTRPQRRTWAVTSAATRLRAVSLSRYALQQELSQRDRLGIATSCAALQLLPSNASHLDRLCALSATALSLGRDDGRPPDTDDLARWLITGPTLHRGATWDPYEGPFAEPINFYGGGYVLQSGGNAEAVFNLRTLLSALFAQSEPLGDRPYALGLLNFARSVLALATHACAVGNVKRWASPEENEHVQIVSPAAMAFLSAGVLFARNDLEAVIDADPEVLSPIVHDLAAHGAPPQNANGTQFNVRPLLRTGDTFLLVEPGSLALALRHALVTSVLARGLRSELVERLARASMVAVIATGKRMSWSVQHEYSAAAAPIVSLAGSFDTDKAFDIAVVYEDFENYSDNDPESTWDLMRWETALSEHLRTVEEGLMYGAGERPNEILHVVVIAGCGRPYVLGISASDVVMPQLPISLENFHQIGMATLDPMRIWKFAGAGERLREYCTAFAYSMIDEYDAWSETESYYFGDDGRPTFVTFDPSYGRAYREKVARDTDVHGAISPGGGWTEVVRLHEAPHIPIYGLLNSPGDEALMLVEGAPLPVWVRAADFAAGTRRTLFQLVDCVAYWLWQTTPSLAHLGAVGTPRVIVDIVLSEPDLWSAETTETGGEVTSTESPAAGILRLIVNPSLRTMLDSPDNAGERALVAVLLNGLDALLPADVRVGEGAIDAAVERHAPLGPKKKISVFTAATEVALVDNDLSGYRRISRADTEEALDEAGEHLGTTLNLPVAEIPSHRKTEVLNAAVAFHFAQLEREVAALSPAGLLEHLVSMHEAILHHEAIERRTLGARWLRSATQNYSKVCVASCRTPLRYQWPCGS
jgi:hypothetical protein